MDRSPTEPHWLTEAETRTWLALASLMIRLPAALDDQLRRDAGISHFEYTVLAQLSEAEGHQRSMSELAFLADGSLSRLSHCVKRLEGSGWVRRSQHPTNGRTTIATLTEAGFEKVKATAPGHVEAVRHHVFAPLTVRQIAELRRIADRIAATIPSDVEPHPALGR